jgi:hypothetical protein
MHVQNYNLFLHTAQLLDLFHRKYYAEGICTCIRNTGRIWAGNRYRWVIKETERGNVNWGSSGKGKGSERRPCKFGDIPSDSAKGNSSSN